MDHIGIDLHKKESQICILGAGGELSEQRVHTTPDQFADVLGDLSFAKIPSGPQVVDLLDLIMPWSDTRAVIPA
jgi:hypothetical protein